MPHTDPELPVPADLIAAVRAKTPARILMGSAGPAYRTQTALDLRQDHAAAVDAVHAELDLARDFPAGFAEERGMFEVRTRAGSKTEYLMRPDLGRRLNDAAREAVIANCPRGADLQFAIGDGLSAEAVAAQVPRLLPMLEQRARDAGRSVGRTFVIHGCRVGVLNDIGELLDPVVVVLLIGERPGLATAESLSAYLALHPKPGDTDAKRNLVCNIHARGVPVEQAAARIMALAEKMRAMQLSGTAVKEDLSLGVGA